MAKMSVNINPAWLYPGNRSTVREELMARIETLRRDAERFDLEAKELTHQAEIARRAHGDAKRLKAEYEAVLGLADDEEAR